MWAKGKDFLKWNGGCQGPGRRIMGSCSFMGTELQFYKMKMVLEMDGGDGCTKYRCT